MVISMLIFLNSSNKHNTYDYSFFTDSSKSSPGSEKKAKSNQRKGFLATLRERLYFRKSKAATTAISEDKDTSSVPSQDLSSCKYGHGYLD